MNEKIAILEKYNFWNKNISNLGFIRKKYIKKINNFLSNKLIKVLIGQRRAGKSYILRQIMLQLLNSGVAPKNILYINKEFTDFDFLNNQDEMKIDYLI